jgi:hypothetical protein
LNSKFGIINSCLHMIGFIFRELTAKLWQKLSDVKVGTSDECVELRSVD